MQERLAATRLLPALLPLLRVAERKRAARTTPLGFTWVAAVPKVMYALRKTSWPRRLPDLDLSKSVWLQAKVAP